MNAPKELYFYDDWLAQHTKGKLLCGNNKYLHENHVDALLKAEREKALREAAENLSVYAPSLVDGPEHDVGYYYGYTTALHRVLDLISEDKTDG